MTPSPPRSPPRSFAIAAAVAAALAAAVTVGCSAGGSTGEDLDPQADPAVLQRGRAVYGRVCAACHQVNGQGLPGAFPPLAGSEWVTAADPSVPVRVVLHGLEGEIQVRGQTWRNVMIAQGDILSDAEIADVLSFVRAAWGNRAPPISADTVTALRAQHATRTSPWTAAEIKP